MAKIETSNRILSRMTRSNDTENNSSGRSYGGQSQDARKQQRKAQILEAGLNVFGSTGFRSATVRSLCKEAELTSRYFYESFENLEALVVAVYEDCMQKLGKQVLDVVTGTYDGSNAEQAIKAGLDAYYSGLEDARVSRVCLFELEAISPEVTQLCFRHMGGLSQLLVALASYAYPHWDLDNKEKEVLGISIVGALRQSATVWLLEDYKTERSILVSASSKLLLGMIAVTCEEAG
ncbi:MAG: TetR/AcrR family transcriptional regulator [Bermanella sp.]